MAKANNMDWRKFVYQPPNMGGADVNVPYQSPNVAPSTPITVNPTTAQPVPAPDVSGLYAIYGRKNPYSARADRLGTMAGVDMGGRLGQLPGIVATYLGAKAAKKSEEFEAEKDRQVQDFLKRKELYDKQQNDESIRLRNAERFEKEVAPAMNEAWMAKYKETKDPVVAGKLAASVGNDKSTELGIGTPRLLNYNIWEGGKVTAVWEAATGKIRQGVVSKDGKLGVINDKRDVVPTAPEDMLFDDYAKLEAVRVSRSRASALEQGYDLTTQTIDTEGNVKTSKVSRRSPGQLSPQSEAPGFALNSVSPQLRPVVQQEIISRVGADAFRLMNPRQQVNLIQNITSEVSSRPQQTTPTTPLLAPAPAAQPQTEAQQAAAWIAANPNAPASQIAAIKAKYRLP